MTSVATPRLGRQALPYESPGISRYALATEAGDAVEGALETPAAVVVARSLCLRASIAARTRRDVAVPGAAVPHAVTQNALTWGDVWAARARSRAARGQHDARHQDDAYNRPASHKHGRHERSHAPGKSHPPTGKEAA